VTAAEVVALPELSVALAVNWCAPATVVLVQASENGALASSPSLVPLSKNSTLTTEPSLSAAFAERATEAPVEKLAPLAGAVMLTVGDAPPPPHAPRVV